MKQLTLEEWEKALHEVSGIPDKALRRILLRVRQRLDIVTDDSGVEEDVTRVHLVRALHKKRVLGPHKMRTQIVQMLREYAYPGSPGSYYLDLYSEFERRTGFSIHSRWSISRTGLQIVQDFGMMEEMYNLALEMYGGGSK